MPPLLRLGLRSPPLGCGGKEVKAVCPGGSPAVQLAHWERATVRVAGTAGAAVAGAADAIQSASGVRGILSGPSGVRLLTSPALLSLTTGGNSGAQSHRQATENRRKRRRPEQGLLLCELASLLTVLRTSRSC